MEDKINQPIVKEQSILQDCSTGHHAFDGGKAMLAMYNGVLEMRVKCRLCGAERAEPIPALTSSLTPETMPKDDGPGVPTEGLERNVPVETKPREAEPEVQYQEPMQAKRDTPLEPPWADEIRNKYDRDKGLDGFWNDIRERARGG